MNVNKNNFIISAITKLEINQFPKMDSNTLRYLCYFGNNDSTCLSFKFTELAQSIDKNSGKTEHL